MRKWLVVVFLAALVGVAMADETKAGAASGESPAASAPVRASDAPPRRYAVLSLIGDELGVVNNRGQAGTNLSTARNMLKMSSPVFDRVALIAVNDVFKQSRPPMTSILLAPSSSLYAAQAQFFDGSKFLVPAELDATLKAQQATHLLLITKHRAASKVRFADTVVGSGRLEGLGYYVDHELAVKRVDTADTGVGFLAPYAYFMVSIVDLGSSAVIGSLPVTATHTITPAGVNGVINPWDVLTSDQKMDLLKEMVKEQVTLAVGKLVSGVPSTVF